MAIGYSNNTLIQRNPHNTRALQLASDTLGSREESASMQKGDSSPAAG